MKMDRLLFSESLSNEFFTEEGLKKLTGLSSFNFCQVIAKELIDNALDETEKKEHGIIITSVNEDNFSIWDNGNGLISETIEKILDFGGRSTTKGAYLSPSRGRQGNAFKTIFGIAHVMDTEGTQVIIESGGRKHLISHKKDFGGNIKLCHEVEDSNITNGTLIKVLWKSAYSFLINPLINNIEVFNPHISLLSVKNTDLNLSKITLNREFAIKKYTRI